MAATFTWKIDSLKVAPTKGDFTNVVVSGIWSCNAQEENHTAFSYGEIGFDAPGDAFTDYENLTESQVLEWIWEKGLTKNDVETGLQQQINNKINPPIITPKLPWVEDTPVSE